MPQTIYLGGSANLVISTTQAPAVFQLTGLDNNEQVLETINVQIVDKIAYTNDILVALPYSATLNYRNVTININRGDFTGILAIIPNETDKICGVNQPVKLEVNTNATQQVQLLQGNNWTIGSTITF